MAIEEIVLAPLEESMLHAFSRQLTEDGEWREFAEPSDTPFAWLTQRSTSQSLGWSYTQGIFLEGGTLVGFITGDWVDSAWVTEDTALENNNSVIECGTYLLKSYRKIGLNAQIKQATLDWAAGLGAQVVVYVVPAENTSAVNSLRREFPAHEYAEARHKRFSAWLKYREWKQGGKLVLFAIPCELKNR